MNNVNKVETTWFQESNVVSHSNMDLPGFCQVVGNEEEALDFLETNGLIRSVPPGL